jgi:hypothetical protein
MRLQSIAALGTYASIVIVVVAVLVHPTERPPVQQIIRSSDATDLDGNNATTLRVARILVRAVQKPHCQDTDDLIHEIASSLNRK